MIYEKKKEIERRDDFIDANNKKKIRIILRVQFIYEIEFVAKFVFYNFL